MRMILGKYFGSKDFLLKGSCAKFKYEALLTIKKKNVI